MLFNQVTLSIGLLILLIVVGWYARGFYDFLRGLKPVSEGWVNLVQKVDKIEEDLTDLRTTVTDLRTTVTDLRTTVTDLRTTVTGMAGGGYAESRSPTSLNDKGREIAGKINAAALVEKYADKVQIDEGATAYAIQQACFHFALDKLPDLITKDEMKLIEETAFSAGAEKETIFRVIVGILLRDKVLRSKGIPIEKVDKAA